MIFIANIGVYQITLFKNVPNMYFREVNFYLLYVDLYLIINY